MQQHTAFIIFKMIPLGDNGVLTRLDLVCPPGGGLRPTEAGLVALVFGFPVLVFPWDGPNATFLVLGILDLLLDLGRVLDDNTLFFGTQNDGLGKVDVMADTTNNDRLYQ